MIIYLSFDELRLIAQSGNISDYKNKSKEDLIKLLNEKKPETAKIPKPETPKTQKLETSKTPKPKQEIRVNQEKLNNLRQDFHKLRYKFSKKEIDRYRKAFYIAKNKKYLSKSEIKNTNKSFNKFEERLRFKKFHGIENVDYEDLDNDDYNYDFEDDDKYTKIGRIRTLFKELDSDYYKPIRTDSDFL